MSNTATITTFWSATGGVGKTTLAVAKAITLAKEKAKVAILDFNEVTPSIHKMLDLKPVDITQVYDAIEQKSITVDKIKPYLQKKHGIWVLTGVNLREFDRFETKHFSAIIQVLKNEFSHIVIDCNSGIFFASTLAALKDSDEIKVVTVPTRNCIEDTTMFMNFVQDNWRVKKDKFEVVPNMVRPGGVEPEKLKALFGDIKTINYVPKALKIQESGKIFMPQEMNISQTENKPKKGFFSLIFKGRGKDIVADKSV